MPKPEFGDSAVAAAFSNYAPHARTKLLALRRLIFSVAKQTAGVGQLHEALRWNQPSYLTPETGSGSTIRLDEVKSAPNQIAIYFHCQSGLIEAFRQLYGDEMTFVGNRSIVFSVGDALPEAALRHCISMALTYHLRKRGK